MNPISGGDNPSAAKKLKTDSSDEASVSTMGIIPPTTCLQSRPISLTIANGKCLQMYHCTYHLLTEVYQSNYSQG